MLTAGSLFSGVGALDLAVHEVFGASTVWFAEHEPAAEKTPRPRNAAAKVLECRFPGAPNLGDVTVVDWAQVEPVGILAAGYPCQPESQAGKQLGEADDRWLWPVYLKAITRLRPRWAVGENVEGHVRRGLRGVVADLQGIGYAVAWVMIPASVVGACHQRNRVFWLAWPEECGGPAWASKAPFAHLNDGAWGVDGLFGFEPVGQWPYQGAAYQGAAPSSRLLPTPVARDVKGGNQRGDSSCLTGALLPPTPNAALGDTHRGGWPNPETAASRRAQGKMFLDDAISVLLPTPTVTDSNGGRNATAGRSNPDSAHHAGTTLCDAVWSMDQWRQYEPAIRRWEAILGRPAPDPTGPYGRNGEQRLCGRFTEWMMGMPAGWITDVPGVSNKDAIRACGNGVVPQQAAAAYRWLLSLAPAQDVAA